MQKVNSSLLHSQPKGVRGLHSEEVLTGSAAGSRLNRMFLSILGSVSRGCKVHDPVQINMLAFFQGWNHVFSNLSLKKLFSMDHRLPNNIQRAFLEFG